MSSAWKFITGSQYTGHYNTPLHCMHGYGRYIFPDGSEYRGYFDHGLFHGYGRIRLASPYSFTFKGYFENGVLKDVDEMLFADGLRFAAELKNLEINTQNWSYCCPADRRFSEEHVSGIRPAGPTSGPNVIHTRPVVGGEPYKKEGKFNVRTGFLTQIPKPFCGMRFIGCNKELHEMETRYLVSCAVQASPTALQSGVCGKVARTGINKEKKLLDGRDACNCSKPRTNKNFLKIFRSDDQNYDMSSSILNVSSKSSSSDESFFVPPPIKQTLYTAPVEARPAEIYFTPSSSNLMQPHRQSLNLMSSHNTETF